MDINPVIDLHCHPSLKTFLFHRKFEDDNHSGEGWNFLEYMILDMLVDLPKLTRGGVNAIISAVYLPEKQIIDDCKILRFILSISDEFRDAIVNDPFEMTKKIISQFEKCVDDAKPAFPKVCIARSVAELKNIINAGGIAVMHGIEGAHTLGTDLDSVECYLDRVQAFYDMGVCMMTVGHFFENAVVAPVEGLPPIIKRIFCRSYGVDLSKGLTPLGEQVVEKMISLGMLVDLAHSTPLARARIFEINNHRRPMVFSHAGVCSNPMNPTPAEIRQVADSGGIIGVIFNSYWLSCVEQKFFLDKDLGLDLIANTIDILKQQGGIDAIGIGTDFDGFTDPPDDVKDISKMPVVRECLGRRGYSEVELDKILGGNALRVLEEGWR